MRYGKICAIYFTLHYITDSLLCDYDALEPTLHFVRWTQAEKQSKIINGIIIIKLQSVYTT